MYKINNKKNCEIYNSSLFQDLADYKIIEDSSGPSIRYTENYPISLNFTAIENFINTSVTKDVWIPVIIDLDITHKPVFDKQNIRNKILGLENVVSFPAVFKNWQILDTSNAPKSKNMSVNWCISSMIPSFSAEYGILFWYKINSAPSSYGLDNIPIGSIINSNSVLSYGSETLATNVDVVKINNNTLKRLDKKSNNITGTNIVFGHEKQIIELDSCSPFDIKTNTFSYSLSNNQFKKNDNNYSIWISDGEAFSYFNGYADERRSRNTSAPSKTYLSPLLMPIYREIYNILTLRRTKKNNTPLDLPGYQAPLLQKLCYFLSTHPLIDRTTVSALNTSDVHNSVQSYLESAQTDTATEISSLITVINNICAKYKENHLIDYPPGKQTNNINYINNKKDLIQKLLYKYGASLYIDDDTVLRFRRVLNNGPHAFIDIGSFSIASSSIASTVQLYNNFKIDIGNMSYATDISTTGSMIRLNGTNLPKPVEVPLVDVSITRDAPGSFYLGSGKQVTFTAPETIISDVSAFGSNDDTYFWEQIGGPQCLRFDDYNKDGFSRARRYTTSTDYNPGIYIRQSGTYKLRCTRNSNGIIESDEITISTVQPPSDSDITVPPPAPYNKIIDSVPRKIGFNKYGMIAILDTNHYIRDDNTFRNIASFGENNAFRLKDVKIDIKQDSAFVPQKDNAELKISFLAANGDTKILVNSIGLQNARDGDSSLGQCSSFFEEKIYKDLNNPNLPILGSSNFSRDYGYQYSLGYYNNTGKLLSVPNSTPSFPSDVSTVLAPEVVPYGGYTKTKVDKIGILLPSHPRPENNCKLPFLFVRNEVTEPRPTGVLCHLKEVRPTGNHFTVFNKGFFHPFSGWISTTDSIYSQYEGKSSVIDDSVHKQKTFSFKGYGFYNLTPSDYSSGSLQPYQSEISIIQNQRSSSEQYGNNYGYKNYNGANNLDPNFVVDENPNNWTSIYDYGLDCSLVSTKTYGFADPNVLNNLYIQDIEVKINFLNYPNPKNLVIWLDVYNPSVSNPSTSTMLDSTDPALFTSTNPELTSYYNAIQSMNATTPGIVSTIYLLNQEHISNYDSNFSLTFSDNTDKNKTTNKQNYKYSTQLGGISPIYNNDHIQPTRYAFGYNDLDASKNINILKTNKLNDINSSFLKLKNIPLKDTKLRLNIGVISPIDHINKVLDNLLINNIVAGGRKTENLFQSDTLNNSICSWEVKIHTDRIVQNSNKDVLGKINYSGFAKDPPSSLVNGYNFIGNFADSQYLIPAVNINAPYDYLANINKCSYVNPDIGKNISYIPPTFPSLMPYFMLGTAALGVGGMVGALGATYAINAALSNGGRNEPIINFLIETRLSEQTETQDQQFYKPVYSQKFFGSPGRAVICVSSDNIYWYTIDVPIFKLSNTPVLSKNIYKYTKLYGGILPGISNFDYTVIKNYTDLDLAPVVHTFTSNVDSLSGLLSLSSDNSFFEGDLVLVSGQSIASDNGYYIIRSGGWEKVPNIASSYFLQQNSISSLFQYATIDSGKHILIDGIRAYNFFDKLETLEFQTTTGKAFAKVEGKSYIYTTTGVKTVLTFNIAITQSGKISKNINDTNVLWIYKDDITSVGDINNWILEKTKKEKGESIDPYNFPVAYGEGSFNSGSDQLDPEILYKISFSNNEIQETHKLLNNQENDKFKLNDIVLGSGDSKTFLSFSSSDSAGNLLKAYSYSTYQFLNHPLGTGIANSGTDNLASVRVSNSIVHDFANKHFMELKSDKFKTEAISPTGSIYIENDFKNTTNSLTTTNDGKYWIHIDPDQMCELNDELSVKVLKETRVLATPLSSVYLSDGIGPDEESHMTPQSSHRGITSGIDESLIISGTTYKYLVSESGLNIAKSGWPNTINWSNPEKFEYGDLEGGDSKRLHISILNSPQDILLSVQEEYIRPSGTQARSYGRIGDRIDLSGVNSTGLFVKFRNIPRKLKGLDCEDFVRYVYDSNGNIVRSVKPPGSVGKIENNFTCWHCIDASGKYMTEIPAYYKLANEMRYRAFFGSNDGIENKNIPYLDSKNDWEWIPYEYYTSQCSTTFASTLFRDGDILAGDGYGGWVTEGGRDRVEYQGGVYSMTGKIVKEIVEVALIRPGVPPVFFPVAGNVNIRDSAKFTRINTISDDLSVNSISIDPIGSDSQEPIEIRWDAHLSAKTNYPEFKCSKDIEDVFSEGVGLSSHTRFELIPGSMPRQFAVNLNAGYGYIVSKVIPCEFFGDDLPEYKLTSNPLELADIDPDNPIPPRFKTIIDWDGPDAYWVRTFFIPKRVTLVAPHQSLKLIANPLGSVGLAGSTTFVDPKDYSNFKIRIESDPQCSASGTFDSCETVLDNIIYDSSNPSTNSTITIPEGLSNARILLTLNSDVRTNLSLTRIPCTS